MLHVQGFKFFAKYFRLVVSTSSTSQRDMMAKPSLIVVAALLPYVCQSTFTPQRKPQSCADGNCEDANRLKRQLLEQILEEIEEKEALIEQRRVQQQKLEVQRHRQVQQQQLAELYQHLEHQQQLHDQQEEL